MAGEDRSHKGEDNLCMYMFIASSLFSSRFCVAFMQYYTHHGFLLVDKTDDIFITFHMLVVNIIEVIAKSFYAGDSMEQKNNLWLRKWQICTVSGCL